MSPLRILAISSCFAMAALQATRIEGPLQGRMFAQPHAIPMPVWRDCKLPQPGKLSSPEEEHTRSFGSAPERTLRKQSARSLQALIQRPHRNVGTDCSTADCERTLIA